VLDNINVNSLALRCCDVINSPPIAVQSIALSVSVCLYVCLSKCLSVYMFKLHTKLSVRMLTVAVAQSSSVDKVMRYVLPV